MKSETFGEYIRKLRKENRMSLRQLADKIDFDQSSLSKIERGGITAPQNLVKPLAKNLGIVYRELQIKYLSEKLYYELKDADYPIESIEAAKKRLEREKGGTKKTVEKAKLIQKIINYLDGMPVEKAWIFGSFARNQESLDSDIDLIVRFVKPNKIDLFDYVGMSQELENITGRQIDLVEEGFILPRAREKVEKEKIMIYERKAG